MKATFFSDGRNLFGVLLLLFVLVVATFFIVIPWYKADQIFVSTQYHGVVKTIEHKEGDRGIPNILINDGWRALSPDESKIVPHLEVGDSIVKKKGRQIDIYKKRDGKYQYFGTY